MPLHAGTPVLVDEHVADFTFRGRSAHLAVLDVVPVRIVRNIVNCKVKVTVTSCVVVRFGVLLRLRNLAISSCQCFVLPLSEDLYQMRVLSTPLSGGIGLKPKPLEKLVVVKGLEKRKLEAYLGYCQSRTYLAAIWAFSRLGSGKRLLT